MCIHIPSALSRYAGMHLYLRHTASSCIIRLCTRNTPAVLIQWPQEPFYHTLFSPLPCGDSQYPGIATTCGVLVYSGFRNLPWETGLPEVVQVIWIDLGVHRFGHRRRCNGSCMRKMIQ